MNFLVKRVLMSSISVFQRVYFPVDPASISDSNCKTWFASESTQGIRFSWHLQEVKRGLFLCDLHTKHVFIFSCRVGILWIFSNHVVVKAWFFFKLCFNGFWIADHQWKHTGYSCQEKWQEMIEIGPWEISCDWPSN